MKIVCITGTRAEYGVMRTLLHIMEKDKDIELSMIVTGMHLMEEYGNTYKEVEKDGHQIIAKIDMKLEENNTEAMSKGIGYALIEMTNCFSQEKPDLVLIVGDRGEMLAAAISAAHLNIPLAHISGGDTTTGATIDERIRHAITIFSDIHFPANEISANNIIKLGENKDLVFAVGNPGIPIKYELNEEEKQKIRKKYHLSEKKKLIIVLQHPTTTQAEKAGVQMKETLDTIKEMNEQCIIIYPNSDSGSKDMIKIIEEYSVDKSMQSYKSIPYEDFHKLLAISDVLVGNSSCALIEAPSFQLPCVNIGNRQEGRERANNIIDAKHNKESIKKAIKKALSKEFKESLTTDNNIYAAENPEKAIIDIIKKIDMNNVLEKKRNHTL